MALQQRDRFESTPTQPDPILSIAEAATLCEVSADTIRRRLRAGAFPDAWREGPTESHQWKIPASNLVRAKLCTEATVAQLDDRLNPSLTKLATQLADARAELANEQTKRQAVEQLLSQANSEILHLRRTVDRLLEGAGAMRVSA